METIKRRMLLRGLKVLTLGLMAFSFGLSTILVFSGGKAGVSFSQFLSLRISLRNFVTGGVILVIWHFIFSFVGVYESKRFSSSYSLILETAKATTVATLSFAAIGYLCDISMASRQFVALLWILSSASVIFARVVIQFALHSARRRGRNLRHILIVGTNSRAIAFADGLIARPELGYHILGFVDNEWSGSEDLRRSNHRLCCNLHDLPAFLRRNVVEEVAIYLPLQSFYRYVAQVVALCEQHGIVSRFDSDIFNVKLARLHAVEFDGNSHIWAKVASPEGWPSIAKRAIDIAVSSVLLLFLAPLFASVAILIKFTSDGPVFFVQERVGLNKRQFRIFKFRTMVVNAEKMMADLEKLNEVSGPVFKITKDPRITRVGRFLRRTSIDELPQLLNVLNGDMSLVGPRPLPIRDYEGFSEDWQRRRFSVRPGITCLWQVNGRSSISFDQWMKLDLQYMDQWSLWLDLKILARTVPAVLKGSGAA